MKTKLFTLIITTAVTFIFNACGDGGASFVSGNGDTIISLNNVKCKASATSNDISNYETLFSNDTIIKEDNNATVIIYHDISGVKKICLVDNGSSAHIVR